MNLSAHPASIFNFSTEKTKYLFWLPSLVAGLLYPLGFAPFHLPGLAILSLAILFGLLQQKSAKKALYTGFFFGLGFLGLGVSWIYVSIHEYGNISFFLASIITLFFIFLFSLYPALMSYLYIKLAPNKKLFHRCIIFSSLWCLFEYLRATLMGGFPWLLLGFSQVDTPIKYLLPLVGIYGAGFIACLASTFLAASIMNKKYWYWWTNLIVFLLLVPSVIADTLQKNDQTSHHH